MANKFPRRGIAVVSIGFICEGITEKTILDSADFRDILQKNNINVVGDIIDAEGNGNLLPENIEDDQNKLFKAGADFILILTDLDNDACITRTKERIGSHEKQIIIVSVKQVEAWFLADSITIRKLLGEEFDFQLPENETQPFEKIRQIFMEKTNRGVGTKAILAKRMIKYGFSIENAANHPNCPSAHYFLNKLTKLNQANS